jgi:hypothetical protein
LSQPWEMNFNEEALEFKAEKMQVQIALVNGDGAI